MCIRDRYGSNTILKHKTLLVNYPFPLTDLHQNQQDAGKYLMPLRNNLERAGKSIRRAYCETDIPQLIVWRDLRKRLSLKAYKLSMLKKKINKADKIARQRFCADILNRIRANETFLYNVIFSNGATLYICLLYTSRCV